MDQISLVYIYRGISCVYLLIEIQFLALERTFGSFFIILLLYKFETRFFRTLHRISTLLLLRLYLMRNMMVLWLSGNIWYDWLMHKFGRGLVIFVGLGEISWRSMLSLSALGLRFLNILSKTFYTDLVLASRHRTLYNFLTHFDWIEVLFSLRIFDLLLI